MLVVMNMENGKIISDPVVSVAESRILPPVEYTLQAQLLPQPRLQEISFPPRAVCPPPSLDAIERSSLRV